jgi:hypothetical protein
MFKGTSLDERFTETDAINMRKNMAEMSFLLYMTGLMMMLRYLAEGEDDDDKKAYLMYNLNIMHRLQQDLAFYANPMSTMAILRDPLPATGVVTDFTKLMTAGFNYVQDPESDRISRGRNVDQSKLKRAASKTVPGLRVITTTQNLMDQELPSW